MRKFLLMAFLALACLTAKAQKTAQTELKLILHPIQTIQVLHSNVVLEYKTMKDYKDGVSNFKEQHLIINSTGDFNVAIHSSNPWFNGRAHLKAEISKFNNSQYIKHNGIRDINTHNPNIIFSAKRGIDLRYNVKYIGKGDKEYFLLTDPKSEKVHEYTTTVTYTIAPQ